MQLRDYVYGLDGELVFANLIRLFQGVEEGGYQQQHREGVVVFPPLFARKEGELDSQQQVNRIAYVKTDRYQLYHHVHAVIVYAEIPLLDGRLHLHQSQGQQRENIVDSNCPLVGEDVHCHQHDIEVGDRLQEGDVGDEDCWVLPALPLQVEQAGDQQRDWIKAGRPKVDTTAVLRRATSKS